MQIPVTPSDIETGAFWHVAQCLNRLRQRALYFASYNSLTSVQFRSNCTENNRCTNYILLRATRFVDTFNQSKIMDFQANYNTSRFIYLSIIQKVNFKKASVYMLRHFGQIQLLHRQTPQSLSGPWQFRYRQPAPRFTGGTTAVRQCLKSHTVVTLFVLFWYNNIE